MRIVITILNHVVYSLTGLRTTECEKNFFKASKRPVCLRRYARSTGWVTMWLCLKRGGGAGDEASDG